MASSKSSMEAHLQLNEIFFSAAKPMALQAAVLLGIPDIIAIHGSKSPLALEDISSYISASTNKPANMDYLFRIMRLLASVGVFTEDATAVDGSISQFKYGLTNVSDLLVNKHNQQSCAPFLLVTNHKMVVESYQHLHESVIDGSYAFNQAHGMNLWKYLSINPEANRVFNEGMASHTRDVMASVVKMYDGFKSVNSLVDVAGGVGSALSTIIKEYPHINGINFDLPHVIASAPPIYGVEHVEGDMFHRIPPADAVFMKWILHDWDDEQCVKLLKKSYEATPENGKVLIVDAVIDRKEGRKRQVGLLFDVCMMGYTSGGKERTEEEFKELFHKAGFRSYKILNLPALQALIE
ncbi:hypothetical protein KI387_021829, partial [Taxus chinensis]